MFSVLADFEVVHGFYEGTTQKSQTFGKNVPASSITSVIYEKCCKIPQTG